MQKSNLIYTFCFFILLLIGFNSISLLSANQYNIIPYPQKLVPQFGTFVLNSNTRILCDSNEPEVLKIAKQFTTQIKLVTGFNLNINNPSAASTDNVIVFQKNSNPDNPEAIHNKRAA